MLLASPRPQLSVEFVGMRNLVTWCLLVTAYVLPATTGWAQSSCQLLSWSSLPSGTLMSGMKVAARPGQSPVVAYIGGGSVSPAIHDLYVFDDLDPTSAVQIALPYPGAELQSFSFDSVSNTYFAVWKGGIPGVEALYLSTLDSGLNAIGLQLIHALYTPQEHLGGVRSDDNNILSFVVTNDISSTSYRDRLFACTIMSPRAGLAHCGVGTPTELYRASGSYPTGVNYDRPGIKGASVLHDGTAPVSYVVTRSNSLLQADLWLARGGSTTLIKRNNLAGREFYHNNLVLGAGVTPINVTYVDWSSGMTALQGLKVADIRTGTVISVLTTNSAVINPYRYHLTSRRPNTRGRVAFEASNVMEVLSFQSGSHGEVIPFSATSGLYPLVMSAAMDDTIVVQNIDIQGLRFFTISDCP